MHISNKYKLYDTTNYIDKCLTESIIKSRMRNN